MLASAGFALPTGPDRVASVAAQAAFLGPLLSLLRLRTGSVLAPIAAQMGGAAPNRPPAAGQAFAGKLAGAGAGRVQLRGEHFHDAAPADASEASSSGSARASCSSARSIVSSAAA